jgi:hypothetical protein
MTQFGLEPAYVKLDYISVWGAHSHLIPLKEWILTNLSGTMGSFINWAGAPVDAEVMIDDLVDLLAPLHKADTTYTLATIYKKLLAEDPALPVASKALTVVGTSALTTHAKAIQATLNMRSLGVQPVKLVFLDVPHSGGDFDKVPASGFDADINAIVSEFTNINNAWSARDNTRPNTGISVTWNLNQELRKNYGMA